MVKRRIRKYDNRNWVIEHYNPAHVIKTGFNEGQMSKGSWMIDGYYGRLEDIPSTLMKKYLSCSSKDVSKILAAIERAKQECLKVINEFIEGNESL